MKDIKVKPTNTKPKILEKAGNIPKDVKSVMKEQLLNKAEDFKPEFKDKSQQNATDYATDKVEGGMQKTAYETVRAADAAKDFTVKKLKEYRAEKRYEKDVKQAAAQSSAPPETAVPKQLGAGEKSSDAPKTRDNIQLNQTPAKEQARDFVRQKQAERIKTRENVSNPTQMPKADMQIKTKEEYIKAQGKSTVEEHNTTPKTLDNTIKTKQTTIRTKNTDNSTPNTLAEVSNEAARKIKSKEYVMNKQEQKQVLNRMEAEKSENHSNPFLLNSNTSEPMSKYKVTENGKPDANLNSDVSKTITPADNLIKTKENYRSRQADENSQRVIKTADRDIKSFDRVEFERNRLKSLPQSQAQKSLTEKKTAVDTRIKQRLPQKKAVKTRSTTGSAKTTDMVRKAKSIKTAKKFAKQAHASRIAQKKAVTAARKQTAKKAAQEAAKRTAQAAKATAHAIKVVAVKAAQLIAAAAKAVGSAVAALGGWAVLLILLIIIIIVAAIAASPFGIFISDEAADQNSIPLSSIVAECNVELSSILNDIEDSTPHNRVVMEGEQANWDEVVAIFAVKVAGTGDETAEDVVVIDEEKKQKLKAVFWDMNSITSRTETITEGENTETVLYITINSKTKDDMAAEYGFSDKQKEALETLLENNDVIISATQSLAISDGTAKGVIDALPQSLSAERKAVVRTACSLVGKVNYFWGGKSSAIGWDSNWGKMTLVTAEGSRSSGSMRPFGLDCSGLVTWSFINAGISGNAIGHGTQGQIANCTRIPWSQAQAGDLAFLSDLSHVGIVAGQDESGNILVIHCSSSANNVVITSNSIFGFAARPNCY